MEFSIEFPVAPEIGKSILKSFLDSYQKFILIAENISTSSPDDLKQELSNAVSAK
jgi:hypothetical protein